MSVHADKPKIADNGTGSKLRVGERFIPHKLFLGIFIPLALLAYKGLSFGAKLCYGVLSYHAGKNGQCFAFQKTIAAALGVEVNTVQKYCVELQKKRFIAVERKGQGRPNSYYFLWHPALKNSLKSKPLEVDECPPQNGPEESGSGGRSDASRTPQTSASEVDEHHGPYKEEEKFLREPFKRKHHHPDDDAVFSEGKTPGNAFAAIDGKLQQFFADRKLPLPSGKNPSREMHDALVEAGGTPEDLDEFLEDYSGKWTTPPATWKHTRVAFDRWLHAQRDEFAARVADAERRAERERLMLQPMRPADAQSFIETSGERVYLHGELTKRLHDDITPAELLKLNRRWVNEPCTVCTNRGRTGQGVDSTLAFCECWIGQWDKERLGPDWIAGKIQAAAARKCRECGGQRVIRYASGPTCCPVCNRDGALTP